MAIKKKNYRILYLSILLNVISFSALIILSVAHRQKIASYVLQKIYINFSKVNSYHLKASTNFSTLQYSADYVKGSTKYKQSDFRWKYQNKLNYAHLIYNQDNFYLKIDSPQFRDFMLQNLKSLGPQTQNREITLFNEMILNHPFTKGKKYINLDTKFLDSMEPSKEYKKEVIESNALVTEQIVKSLRLAGLPTIKFIAYAPHIKIPIELDYKKLNSILYPSIKSYVVNNQKLLQEILNEVKIDLYLNIKGEIIRIDATLSALSQKQIEQIFDGRPTQVKNIFWDLNDHVISNLSKIKKPYIITFDFSYMNKTIKIRPPKSSIRLQDLANTLLQTKSQPVQETTESYIVDNDFKVKLTGGDPKNFYMIGNMLYRYFAEHGIYPPSLDLLANKYFPGMVPGNPETAQAFFYQTFANSKGYLLCPTSQSSREYCYKRYYLDMVK